MKGVDVSGWQTPVDVPDDVDFVIVKLSEGATFVDTAAAAHIDALRTRATVPAIGGYHYARPDRNGPEVEAALFVAQLSRHGLPFGALDIEERPNRDVAVWAATFCTEVGQAMGWSNERIFIYTSPSYIMSFMRAWPAVARFPLWVAHWHTFDPHVPEPWSDWAIHQYTDAPLDTNRARPDAFKFLEEEEMMTEADFERVAALVAAIAENLSAADQRRYMDLASKLERLAPDPARDLSTVATSSLVAELLSRRDL